MKVTVTATSRGMGGDRDGEEGRDGDRAAAEMVTEMIRCKTSA